MAERGEMEVMNEWMDGWMDVRYLDVSIHVLLYSCKGC